MTRFEAAARILTSALDQLGVGRALVGGFAVSIRTEPRFTQDVDFVVAADDDKAAEQVVLALQRRAALDALVHR